MMNAQPRASRQRPKNSMEPRVSITTQDYPEDCSRLLTAMQRLHRREYRSPLEAIPDLISFFGFRLGRRMLPPHQWALTDFGKKEVWLCSELAAKLEIPSVAREVEAFSLAHELAHVRLHQHLDEFNDLHEKEADAYAACFLMPIRLLRLAPAFSRFLRAETQGAMSQEVSALAQRFGVSRSAMTYRLCSLGVLRVVSGRWVKVSSKEVMQ